MECCPYGALSDYMRKGNRLNESELRDIAACCLLGLNYLHNMKIIYRVDN